MDRERVENLVQPLRSIYSPVERFKDKKNLLGKYSLPYLIVVMKPTEKCNLECDYCYIIKSSQKQRMDKSTLRNIFHKILNTCKKVEFEWHGGEPLLMGLNFYEDAIKIQQKETNTDNIVINHFQTNGTLINDRWISFFKNNNIGVGVSLDGPLDANICRKYPGGKNCFPDVLINLKKLKDIDIEMGVLGVLTKKNISKILDIYKFFKNLNIDFAMLPFIGDGRGKEHNDELFLDPYEYGNALIKLFDVWFNDLTKIKFDDFYRIIRSMFLGFNEECQYSECFSYVVSINPKGDIYPCDGFMSRTQYRLGNINEDDFEDILFSGKRKRLLDRNLGIGDCNNCKWWKICFGGCAHFSYVAKGSIYKKDPFCESRKMLFEHIYKNLKNEMRYKRGDMIEKIKR